MDMRELPKDLTDRIEDKMYAAYKDLEKVAGKQVSIKTIDGIARKIAVDEMKFLQRKISGKTISYSAPTTGSVTTDDMADCITNLIYLLSNENDPEIKRNMTRLGTPRIARRR